MASSTAKHEGNADALLLEAVRRTPRPYLLPPLPADAEQARAAGTHTALAFAIEARRTEVAGAALDAARALFLDSLDALVRQALDEERGDPGFQAQVLKARSPDVREFARLKEVAVYHARWVRDRMDEVAHPGKLRRMKDAPGASALAAAHELVVREEWGIFRTIGRRFMIHSETTPATLLGLRTVMALAESSEIESLARGQQLAALPAVQRYLALARRHGPAAGTEEALDRGRAAGLAGAAAERGTVDALQAIVAVLAAREPAAGWRVARSLRMPPRFPGPGRKGKAEWDAAVLRAGAGGAFDVALLVESKNSPAAGTPDAPKLLRGIAWLGQAEPGAAYEFSATDGPVRLSGDSLIALSAGDPPWPPRAIYTCVAPPEAQPHPLAAASRAALLGEPASIAHGLRVAAGERADPADLQKVWDDLPTGRSLKATLHQRDTMRLARAAMVRPQDLLETVRALA